MYKSTDIYFCSALLTLGATYKETETKTGLKKQVIFVINTENIDVEKLLTLYKKKELSIDAYTFVEVFKHLKQRMYEALNTT